MTEGAFDKEKCLTETQHCIKKKCYDWEIKNGHKYKAALDNERCLSEIKQKI